MAMADGGREQNTNVTPMPNRALMRGRDVAATRRPGSAFTRTLLP
jgi:hypothetical protein